MTILGIRTYSGGVRYALIKEKDDGCTFINADQENKLTFPASASDTSQKLAWLYSEMKRIYHQNPEISGIAIKVNEYGRGSESAAGRESAQFDAIIMLFASQNSIPVITKLYKSLKTNSKNVITDAENYAGKSSLYWDSKMADAVIVTRSARKA